MGLQVFFFVLVFSFMIPQLSFLQTHFLYLFSSQYDFGPQLSYLTFQKFPEADTSCPAVIRVPVSELAPSVIPLLLANFLSLKGIKSVTLARS